MRYIRDTATYQRIEFILALKNAEMIQIHYVTIIEKSKMS